MVDVFISYARSTQDLAEQVALALRALGYQVWRDNQLPAHLAYSDVIEERLVAAKAVVVIWSKDAVRSEWVRSEANRAREARKIVQLSVEAPALPMPFDQIHCADLSGWNGDIESPAWKSVVCSVKALVENEGARDDAERPPVHRGPEPRRSVTNLPGQLTSFVGREREIAEIRSLVREARLVTLTGTGGAGKTRLSLQIGAAAAAEFPDGAWFVELAPLTDPALVPQAVARVLGVKELAGIPIFEAVSRHLAARTCLLLLDNCEHLVDDVAPLSQTLLATCPGLRILASSREPLRVVGEVTYRVPSLATPDPKVTRDANALLQHAAARLFADRALAVKPGFRITDAESAVVADICHRLDGIPLAIELAAARVRSLSLAELSARLDDRFRVLTGGARTVLPRQQTLRALFDWSYDLLDDAEKAIFRRSSVFSGGWTLEAAEQVCSENEAERDVIVDLLTALVDKSLVVAEEREGQTRYRLPETLLAYGRERLRESGEEARWRQRHLVFFLSFAEAHEPKFRMEDLRSSGDRMEQEHDNLRAALSWSIADAAEAESALRLAALLWWFWVVRGFLSEGRTWLERILTTLPPDQYRMLRGAVLYGAGRLAQAQDDLDTAQARFEECLAIARAFGKPTGVANTLRSIGTVASIRGDYGTARSMNEQSLAMSRDTGEPMGTAAALGNLGRLAQEQEDYEAARRLHEESLAIWRQIGNRRGAALATGFLGLVDLHQGRSESALHRLEESLAVLREQGGPGAVAMLQGFLATAHAERGDLDAARRLYVESLLAQTQLGDRSSTIGCVEGLALACLGQGEQERAARLLGGVERLREALGTPLPPCERTRHDRILHAALASVEDRGRFDRKREEGRALTLEALVEEALRPPAAAGDT